MSTITRYSLPWLLWLTPWSDICNCIIWSYFFVLWSELQLTNNVTTCNTVVHNGRTMITCSCTHMYRNYAVITEYRPSVSVHTLLLQKKCIIGWCIPVTCISTCQLYSDHLQFTQQWQCMPSHDRLREKIVSQKTPRIALYKHVLNTSNYVFVYCERNRGALTKFGVKF